MTAIILAGVTLSIWTVASYWYFLQNTTKPQDNGLYRWGHFIDQLWFDGHQ